MYSRENYAAARAEIENRRQNAIATAERRNAELVAESEEIAKIDSELSKTGLLLFKTACSGEDLAPLRARNEELMKKRRKLLTELGHPEDYTDVHYTCKLCSDTGFIDTKMCTCLKQLLIMKNIKSSGMGHLIDKQSFDNFDLKRYKSDPEAYATMQKILKISKTYVERFAQSGGNMLFLGVTGTGKTHMSTAIAKEIISQGYDVIYDSIHDIITCFENDKFKNGYGQKENESGKYLECDLLLIDDLGTEFSTQFSSSVIYNIINTRQNKGLSTIISSNLTSLELSEKYAGRIHSRIIGCDYKVLMFKGKDYRTT